MGADRPAGDGASDGAGDGAGSDPAATPAALDHDSDGGQGPDGSHGQDQDGRAGEGGTPGPGQEPAAGAGQDTPAPPGQRAQRGDGPLGPDAEHGYTAVGEIAGPTDPKVAELFERRADPEARQHHEELMARAEGLRLDSLGYTYSSGGLSSAMLSLFYPESGVREGLDRAFGDNVYSSGEGWVAGLQSGIERIRGIMKVLGEVASAVSTITAAGAGISAAVAGILAITGIGAPVAAGAASLAAALMKVSIIAGLVKAGLDATDALLSIVQMVINVARARNTDDPVERARLCRQMKHESGAFANSLTSAAMGLISAPVGGAGRAVTKGVMAGASAVRRAGLRTSAKQFWQQSVRGAPGRVAAAVRQRMAQLRQTAARVRNVSAMDALLRARAAIPSIPGTRSWRAAKRTAFDKAFKEKMGTLRRRVIDGSMGPAAAARSTAAQAWDTAGGTKKALETGRDIEKAKAGGGPSAAEPGGGPSVNLTYNKVAYWPSVLERMGPIRTDIHSAQGRMRGQYDSAAADAGDKRAAVEALRGEPSQTGTRMRMAGGRQQAEAEAGRQRSEEAADVTQQGLQQGEAARRPLDQARTEGEAADRDATAAERGVRTAPPRAEESWWDRAKRWAYENTIGRAFRGLAWLQKKISGFVLKVAMSAAGLDQDDMDLAGMQQEATSDAEADQQAGSDAEGTTEEGNTVDAQIAQIKQTGTNQEQAAVQGMVDAGDYITALDGYDQALAQEQDHGTNYIADATEHVAAEADAPLVTATYIQPITDGAAFLQAEARSFPERLREAGTSAVGALAADIDAQGLPSQDGAELGTAVVTAAVASVRSRCDEIADQAGGIGTRVAGLVGTDWFVSVDELFAARLDELNAEFEGLVAGALDRIGNGLSAIADAYVAAAQAVADVGDDEDEPAPDSVVVGPPED